MRHRLPGALAALGVLLLFRSCAVQAVDAPSLSLAQARRRAAERGWDLLSARTDVAQAEANRLSARAVPNPTLSLSVSKVPTDGTPAATARGNGFFSRGYDSVASVGELIEIGKRGPRKASAEAALASSRSKVEDVRRRLDASVVKAYAAAALAEENARVNRLSSDSLEHSATIARERYEAGDVSKSEASQVAIAAGRFTADTRSAEAAAAQARVALEGLLGDPSPSGAVPLADDLARLAQVAAAAQLDSISSARADAAVAERPDVRAAEASVARAESDLELQRAQRLPDPTLSVGYEREPPFQSNTANFGVSLPLPVLNRNAGGIRAAEAALEGARRDLAQVRARAHAEIASAKAAWEAARARRDLLSSRLVPDAESVREAVAFAYSKGGASLLELLEAERNLNDVRLAAASATSDLVSAVADYATALGEPIP